MLVKNNAYLGWQPRQEKRSAACKMIGSLVMHEQVGFGFPPGGSLITNEVHSFVCLGKNM